MNTNYYDFMTVADLRKILTELPDDMMVVIPVVDEDDINRIYGFRKIRTAGILRCEAERAGENEVLCINGAQNGMDLGDQIHFSDRDVDVTKILYGNPENLKGEEK